MEEFRLSMDLYGDEGNFGLLIISDSREKAYDKLPTENFPMEDATPEAIGQFLTEYLKKNCT